MAPLTVVIPTLNAEVPLAATVASLGKHPGDSLLADVIVSDGGSTDATLAVAAGLGAQVLEGSAGRGAQLRRGMDAVQTDWALVLHADTRLSDRWRVAADRHMQKGTEKAGYFRLSFDVNGLAPTLISQGANLRSRLFALPYGDQGLLISRALYQRIGGYRDLPIMEDVDIARRLGRRLAPLDATVETSAARYCQNGWFRQSSGNLVRLSRFLMGADPEKLASGYTPPKRQE